MSRPSEILALQLRHIASDCRRATIEQRLHGGDIEITAGPGTWSNG